MAKILQLERGKERKPFVCKVLLYGKEWEFEANDIPHIIEKITHRDKHADKSDIEMDLELNFKDQLNP